MVATFLPSADFAECARVLDDKRLWKQCLEAHQILNALLDPEAGYQNHPFTRLWRGEPFALRRYITAMVDEWMTRRLPRAFLRSLHRPLAAHEALWTAYLDAHEAHSEVSDPPWLGDERLHASHRAVLLAKGRRDVCLKQYKDDKPWLLGDDHLHDLILRTSSTVQGGVAHYEQFGWTEQPADLTQKPVPYWWPWDGDK